MQDMSEGNKMTDPEVKGEEQGEHTHDSHPLRWNRRTLISAVALLLVGVIAAVGYRGWSGGKSQSAAPRMEAQTPVASPVASNEFTLTDEEQLRQIAVEPVAERTIDMER